MDQVHSTTEQHVKGKHLTYDERMIIQIRHKEGWSPNRIVAEIGCAPNTVRNELRRGTVDLYNGHVQRCKARQGQLVYRRFSARLFTKSCTLVTIPLAARLPRSPSLFTANSDVSIV